MNEERAREIFREELLKFMGNYNNIPLEVVNALGQRLPSLLKTGTGTFGTQIIDTSGPTATVPAQPSGTLKVAVGGITYELLFK